MSGCLERPGRLTMSGCLVVLVVVLLVVLVVVVVRVVVVVLRVVVVLVLYQACTVVVVLLVELLTVLVLVVLVVLVMVMVVLVLVLSLVALTVVFSSPSPCSMLTFEVAFVTLSAPVSGSGDGATLMAASLSVAKVATVAKCGAKLGSPQVSRTRKLSPGCKSKPLTPGKAHVCPLMQVKDCMGSGPIRLRLPKSETKCSAKLQMPNSLRPAALSFADELAASLFGEAMLAFVPFKPFDALVAGTAEVATPLPPRAHQHKRYSPPFAVIMGSHVMCAPLAAATEVTRPDGIRTTPSSLPQVVRIIRASVSCKLLPNRPAIAHV
jgi:hypothetical protein